MLNVEASILDHRQFAALRSRETKIFTSGPYVIDHEAIETELGLVNVIIDKRGSNYGSYGSKAFRSGVVCRENI